MGEVWEWVHHVQTSYLRATNGVMVVCEPDLRGPVAIEQARKPGWYFTHLLFLCTKLCLFVLAWFVEFVTVGVESLFCGSECGFYF